MTKDLKARALCDGRTADPAPTRQAGAAAEADGLSARAAADAPAGCAEPAPSRHASRRLAARPGTRGGRQFRRARRRPTASGARTSRPTRCGRWSNACSLPVAVAGALMPDAHLGYGLPIGGVLATENAVIPYAVGVDIACRMKLTVLDLPVDGARRRSAIA